jgi:hypothetical protein
MKYSMAVLLICIIPFLESFNRPSMKNVEGAYIHQHENGEDWLMLKDNYFIHTSFNKASRQFHFSRGGTYQANENQLNCKIEFDTRANNKVGQKETYRIKLNDQSLQLGDVEYKLSDDGSGALAGYYRISGRKQGDKVNEMPLAARKTIKLLTGNKFQWAAINTSTGEFFGTGGGNYTFSNGKYTEHIEFFSRDSSRVGASLEFTDTLKGKQWIHSGLSSKGDPIYEIWSREPISY